MYLDLSPPNVDSFQGGANFLYNMGKIGREAAEYGREAPQNMPVIDVKEDT